VPLAIATGAGALSRQVLGTTVVFGMSAATAIGIFIVPVFYVVIQGFAERLQSSRPAAAAPKAAPPETQP
jgi:HAE1 family hydrophobic/amphiphilic exporter-1/multidrug efflux pump